MRITINAKVEYHIHKLSEKALEHFKGTEHEYADVLLKDGDEWVLVAKKRVYADYVDEVVNYNNECAYHAETFKTRNGNIWVYWYDTDANEDYLSKVVEDDKN